MSYKYLTPAEKILTQKYLKEDLSMRKSIDTIVPFPVKSKGTPKAVTIPGIFITPLQFKNNTLKPAIPNQENLMKKLKT